MLSFMMLGELLTKIDLPIFKLREEFSKDRKRLMYRINCNSELREVVFLK